jgi:anti-sigma factor RsiW
MQAADEDNELGALIRREGIRHMPPAGLAERILADLRQAESLRPIAAPAPRPAAAPPWRWLQALTLFGAGAATAWGLALTLLVAPMQEATSEAVTDSHVRSLMAAHLADVASTDQHTVKPWFQGRTDFSPPVRDLKYQGFPLAGGRLDFLDGRTVAALVYRHRQHVINLFVWPVSESRESAVKMLSQRGYNLAHCTAGGLTFWAVSDLNSDELSQFARLVRDEAP